MELVMPLGQEHILAPALAALRRGRVAQAWLVTGPAGIGKRTAARLFVAAQLCGRPDPAGLPCGRCETCALVAAGSHPDVHWTDAEGKLGVADARALSRAAALRPDGTLSAFVLEACERLTGPAAAALLKTLEDPPGDSLFLLLTEHGDRVEPTLRSRCQLLRLRPVAAPTLAYFLCARSSGTLTPSQAEELAARTGGVVGRALAVLNGGGLAQDGAAAGEAAELLEAALTAATIADAVRAAGRLGEGRASPEQVLGILRDLLLLRRGALEAAGGHVGALDGQRLGRLAPLWTDSALARACALCAEAMDTVPYNVNHTLNWERLVIGLRLLRAEC